MNLQTEFYEYLIFQQDILKIRLAVVGVGGAGCNAVNTMINNKLSGWKLKKKTVTIN